MTNKKTERWSKPEDKAELTAFITDMFRSFPDKAYSLKSVAAAAGSSTRDNRELINGIVKGLVTDGVIESPIQGKYRLCRSACVAHEGIADMTPSGAIYVIVEGLDKDIYVHARRSGHTLHGDKVRVAITRRGKGASGNPEGEIIAVLERSPKKYVGIVEINGNVAFIKVDNRKMPYDIFVPFRKLNGAENGQKVLVSVTAWPDTMKNPEGEVVDVLGMPGDNNTEMHAILAEYDLPYSYPSDVEREAELISEDITPEEIARRKDMRGVTTFTIDPADAKDFDDALSFRTLDNGHYEVGVHIADVTHYVHPGDIVDTEGQNRATSVYLVDRTIPMLPERLSNGLCSLRPNEEKLCFSVVFEMDEEANVVSQWIGRTVIYSDRRFTYQEAQDIIESGEGDFKEEVLALNTLAKKMRKDRFKNGAIAFERDETKFELDPTGKPLSVYFKEMKESNQLIEEFMLMANKKVAEYVGDKKTFVYRIHDKPNADKITLLRNFVLKFGYVMKAESGRAVAKDINKLMKSIHGKQEENIISTLAIRSMAKAVYSTDNIGHYGLAFDHYTHFTSPIRRYPDMMVHRLLEHYLSGGKSEDKEFYEKLCEHSSAMEVRASEAERASIKYKMVEFMLDKLDSEFDGHISGITEWGLYVELEETKIEGMVSLRELSDDFYAFDPETYSVTGRQHKRTFTLGDEVRIRVVRADLARKQLDFDLVATYDFDTREETLVE